jgi:hypothetical protein
VPLYCGETGENDDSWVEAFRETLDENNIGWHYWPYKKMDNTKGIITFKIPQYYDQVIQFADTTRKSFEDIRNTRPKNTEEIEAALNGFLENCRFKNCMPNEGYIKALGFNLKLDSKK